MRFDDLVEINPKVKLTKGKSYPFIKMENVTPGRRYPQIVKRNFIGGGAKFQSGDTLFARITPCLENGKITQFISNEEAVGFGSTEFFVFRNKEGISDPSFIYYLASSDLIRKPAEKSMSGASGRQRADLASIRNAEVPIIDLVLQQKIASILSAYDDLIENNTRRIKILEEMAQSLYREWFINFRFPGHEKVKMVNSPFGKIPKGWTVVKFTDIADVLSGGTPSTKESAYWDGNIPFFTPKDASTNFYVTETEKNITELGLSKCSSQLYPRNTVFITARGTVGKVIMPATDMAMNQSCYALVGNDGISQPFLFFLTRQTSDLLRKHTGGATFSTIIVDTFKKIDILKPADEIIHPFTEQVTSILDKVLNSLYQNINLQYTRDLLLTELISDFRED
ncbi:MAG: restriction endonuclease subunit S [Thermoleophilia bacterium]|nr:restriction endonuclease subunit S [Thermoleophilia bacterium]